MIKSNKLELITNVSNIIFSILQFGFLTVRYLLDKISFDFDCVYI